MFLRTLALAAGLLPGVSLADLPRRAPADGGTAHRGDYVAPSAESVLTTLRPDHPRLVIDGARQRHIEGLLSEDPLMGRVYDNVLRKAESQLAEPVAVHELRDGRRLLYVSSEVSGRVQTLAFAHRMTGDPRYAERAKRELAAVADFPDWNPKHFLDTAVMTGAMAIGYDWLYERLTPQERRAIERAIVEKGLRPALAVYENRSGWHTSKNNWNQVCNGGIGLGSLAIADAEPEVCGRVLAAALESLPAAMTEYAPDGAGYEGVVYWSFGAVYNVLLLDALGTALGTDFGLMRLAGFPQSGDYQLYLSGADRVAFNFSDCPLERVSAPQHFWLAERAGAQHWAALRRERLREDSGRGGVLDLAWWSAAGAAEPFAGLPLHRHFRGAEVASMRSSFTDPGALVLAMQAGDNRNLGMHRQLDLGTWALEARGVRWFVELGKESETYHSHRHGERRDAFYRIRAEGHNTLVINPSEEPDQAPDGAARFVEFEANGPSARAVVDLSAAYPGDVRRTFRLIDGTTVEVADDLHLSAPSTVWWFAHTEAEVALSADGRSATLSQGGERLRIELTSPGGAFRVMPAEPLPTSPRPKYQTPNTGVRKLAVRLDGATDATIAVRITPVDPDAPPAAADTAG